MATVEAGRVRWNRALTRRANDSRRAQVRAEKKAEMDAKRNDAWENIESQ